MNELFEYTKNRLLLKKDELSNNEDLFRSEIREIMQEVILLGLIKTDFFDNNVFQGGTALRMLYGLKRYSEDFDFTMKENKIEEFSWKPYGDKLVEYGKDFGIDFLPKENKDKFGNKIMRIKSDSLLTMIHDEKIVPYEFTEPGNRKKIGIKLETNFSVNAFEDEIKIADIFNKCNVRAFDLPSLFAGKINATLTREETNEMTGKKERTDKGRDWYDLLWYIEHKIDPNYDFLSQKLDYRGPFQGKQVQANIEWVKKELFKRIEGLDYDNLNEDIKSITLPQNSIILTKDLLSEKVNKFGHDDDNWGGSSKITNKGSNEANVVFDIKIGYPGKVILMRNQASQNITAVTLE